MLRVRGDDVVALVRSPDKAKPLGDIGCELVAGDLGDAAALRAAMQGADSVFHVAATYQVGIPASARPSMYESNVVGTENVLDTAIEEGVGRIVHVSTANVFGNTRGRVVDESYERPGNDFLSYYDETKYLAHQLAKERAARGAPVIIVQPSMIYGPNDHSQLGAFLAQAMRGKLRYQSFPEMGFSAVHVDDAAHGILLAHDKGRIGETYVLSGETTTMGEAIAKAARAAGRKPPRLVMPAFLAKMMVPAGPIVGKLMKLPPNLAEAIKAAEGVTYWASSDKARDELGYSPRSLDDGLRTMLV